MNSSENTINDIFQKIDIHYKKTGSLGIDKIIETDKAWILTRKERDSIPIYGNYATVVFKEFENQVLLLTPELFAEIGKITKETDYKYHSIK